MRGDIRELQETVNELKEFEEEKDVWSGYMIISAIALSFAGIAIGIASFAKKK